MNKWILLFFYIIASVNVLASNEEPSIEIPFAENPDWDNISFNVLGLNQASEDALSGYVQWSWNENGFSFHFRLYSPENDMLGDPEIELFFYDNKDNPLSGVIRITKGQQNGICNVDCKGGKIQASASWIPLEKGIDVFGTIELPYELQSRDKFRLGFRVWRTASDFHKKPVVGLKRQQDNTSANWVSRYSNRFPLVALAETKAKDREERLDVDVSEKLLDEQSYLIVDISAPIDLSDELENLTFEGVFSGVDLDQFREILSQDANSAVSMSDISLERKPNGEAKIMGKIQSLSKSASSRFYFTRIMIPAPRTNLNEAPVELTILDGQKVLSQKKITLLMPGLLKHVDQAFDSIKENENGQLFREIAIDQIGKLKQIENADVLNYYDIETNWNDALIRDRLDRVESAFKSQIAPPLELHSYISEMDSSAQPFYYWPPKSHTSTKGLPLYLIFLGYNTINDRYHFVFGDWAINNIQGILKEEAYLHEGHVIFLHGRGNSYGTFGDEDFKNVLAWAKETLSLSQIITQGVCVGGMEAIRFGLRYPTVIDGVDAKSPVEINDMINGLSKGDLTGITNEADRIEILEWSKNRFGFPNEDEAKAAPLIRIMVGEKDFEARVSARAAKRVVKDNKKLKVVTLKNKDRYFPAPAFDLISEENFYRSNCLSVDDLKGLTKSSSNVILRDVVKTPLTIVYGTKDPDRKVFLWIKAQKIQERLRGTTPNQLTGFKCEIVSDIEYLTAKLESNNLWVLGSREENFLTDKLRPDHNSFLEFEQKVKKENSFGFYASDSIHTNQIIIFEMASSPVGYSQDAWNWNWAQKIVGKVVDGVPIIENWYISDE